MDHVWKELVPVNVELAARFDECKDVFMGMSWATVAKTDEERDEEIEFLRESLQKFIH
jgi:hypothetical protein